MLREKFGTSEEISIFSLKIYICNLKIRICSLKICIFNLKIELFPQTFWFFLPIFPIFFLTFVIFPNKNECTKFSHLVRTKLLQFGKYFSISFYIGSVYFLVSLPNIIFYCSYNHIYPYFSIVIHIKQMTNMLRMYTYSMKKRTFEISL